MTPIERALDQMERGMGPLSTPESRAAVNAETMAARAARAEELEARRSASAMTPVPAPAAPTKTWQQRLQDGEYGRLD